MNALMFLKNTLTIQDDINKISSYRRDILRTPILSELPSTTMKAHFLKKKLHQSVNFLKNKKFSIFAKP